MKNTVKRAFQWVLQLPADALVLSSKRLPDIVSRIIMENPSICAKYDPYLEKQASWIIPKTPNDSNMGSDSGFAIPPQELWGGVYDHNTALYLSAGRSHVETMRSITETSDFRFEDGDRILDFGCAGGRMIRWFNDLSDKCEIWGTDVSQACILWCQQHLSPPFKFVTTTSFPHLPFEDGYFKFIYAGSVFTHIPALADAWLLELKRVLCPGGESILRCMTNTA